MNLATFIIYFYCQINTLFIQASNSCFIYATNNMTWNGRLIFHHTSDEAKSVSLIVVFSCGYARKVSLYECNLKIMVNHSMKKRNLNQRVFISTELSKLSCGLIWSIRNMSIIIICSPLNISAIFERNPDNASLKH